MDRVARIFRESEVYLRTNRHIIFVCGGPVDEKKYARTKFLAYANKKFKDFTFFLAEDASRDLLTHSEPQFLNLSEFERLIAGIADCILLFPETPGAIAELGLFSGYGDTCGKLLLANSIAHRADQSFINLGPIATTDSASTFRPTLHYSNLSAKDPTFEDIGKLLKGRLCYSLVRKRFTHMPLRGMKLRDRFLLVHEMVNLFWPLDYEGLNRVLTATFSKPEAKEIKRLLSILIAAKYIKRHGRDRQFLLPTEHSRSFFDVEAVAYGDLRVDILSFYRKYYGDLYKLTHDGFQ